MGSGGVVQRIEKQKWSDLRGSNHLDPWHFDTRVPQALYEKFRAILALSQCLGLQAPYSQVPLEP